MVFEWFSWHLRCQQSFQNPSKSMKNRCQEAPQVGLQIFIKFSMNFLWFCDLPRALKGFPVLQAKEFWSFHGFPYKTKKSQQKHPKNLHFPSQNPPQIVSKTGSRRHQNPQRFSTRFWCALEGQNGAMLEPCWRPRYHKIRPKSMSETRSRKWWKNVKKTPAPPEPLWPTNRATNYIRATQPVNQPANRPAKQASKQATN